MWTFRRFALLLVQRKVGNFISEYHFVQHIFDQHYEIQPTELNLQSNPVRSMTWSVDTSLWALFSTVFVICKTKMKAKLSIFVKFFLWFLDFSFLTVTRVITKRKFRWFSNSYNSANFRTIKMFNKPKWNSKCPL